MSALQNLEATRAGLQSGDKGGWLNDAFSVAYALYDDSKMASAAALIHGAERLMIVGSGPGLPVAEFASVVFAEAGFETLSAHAGDLTTGSLRLQPGDLIIGIDSDSFTVASALRRAKNSGLHTLGVTTRDLTVIDADVLLYVPSAQPQNRGLSLQSVLATCLAMALLAARLAPESSVAADVGKIEGIAHRVTSDSGHLMASILFSPVNSTRVVLAGRGAAKWVARAIARHINQGQPGYSIPPAIHIDLEDIVDGFWTFDHADILIQIDPYEKPAAQQRAPYSSVSDIRPHRMWTYSCSATKSPDVVQLPTRSPALGTLIVFTALSTLLEFAGSSAVAAT
jgi:hypothetical protein